MTKDLSSHEQPDVDLPAFLQVLEFRGLPEHKDPDPLVNLYYTTQDPDVAAFLGRVVAPLANHHYLCEEFNLDTEDNGEYTLQVLSMEDFRDVDMYTSLTDCKLALARSLEDVE